MSETNWPKRYLYRIVVLEGLTSSGLNSSLFHVFIASWARVVNYWCTHNTLAFFAVAMKIAKCPPDFNLHFSLEVVISFQKFDVA